MGRDSGGVLPRCGRCGSPEVSNGGGDTRGYEYALCEGCSEALLHFLSGVPGDPYWTKDFGLAHFFGDMWIEDEEHTVKPFMRWLKSGKWAQS